MLTTGAPIGRDNRKRGKDCSEPAVIGGHDVGAKQGALAVEGHRQTVGIVGTAVVQKLVLDPEDAAVSVQCDLGIVDLQSFLRGGDEMLGSILNPFDRPPQSYCQPGQQ